MMACIHKAAMDMKEIRAVGNSTKEDTSHHCAESMSLCSDGVRGVWLNV